jgi:hypothetical protein
MKIKLLAFLACCMFLTAQAQNNYTATYTLNAGNPGGLNTDADDITAGWTSLIASGVTTNQWSAAVSIPFTFNYYGGAVTELKASTNGLITFNTNPSLPNNNDNLPAAALPDSTIACFWDAFTSAPPTAANDVVVWKVWGSAPNRQLWIKWTSFEIGAPSVGNATFACVLEETTNNIYLVEGAFTVGATTVTSSVTAGVQLNATTAVQHGSRYRPRVSNATALTDNNYITFTPYVKSGMVYASSTSASARVDNVSNNSNDEAMLRIKVTATGELSPIALTQLDLNTTGTTLPADITNAKVFYTGSDSNFVAAQQFGSTAVSPSGTFSITGTKQLAMGDNYFWLTYSISNTAAASNVVDAECTQLIIGGIPQVPSVTSPAGNRTVSTGLSGTVTVGTAATYTYLSDAFKAINANGLSNDVTLSITTDIDDTANAALTYTGNYKISIVPSADVLRNITARFNTPYVQFSNASNIVIDGKGPVSGTGKYLRFVNRTDLGATFNFINGCDHDTIRNTIIEGTSNITTVGVVTFGSSTTSEGNHHLLFTDNDIRDRSDSVGIPAILFYAAGAETALNHSITISNSNLFNFRRSGVYVSPTINGGNWTISGNSFYYNAATTPVGGDIVPVMLIAGNASNNNLISNNYFGGQAPLCGGSAWVSPNAVNFVIMNLNTGIDVGTSVQGNTIQNINMTNGGTLDFAGVRIESGRAEVGNISGNLIGHPTTPNSIQNNMRLTLCIYGFVQGYGEVIVANNTIANISGTGTATTTGVRGICFQGGGASPNIYNNTIYNLSSSGLQTGATTATLMGIGLVSGAEAGTCYIGKNRIYNLSSTAAAANVIPSGIIIDNGTANGVIEKNVVYGITCVSTGATAAIHGLYVAGPVNNWTISNNMIALTNGINALPITMRGISDNAANTANYFYNTVYIGGTSAFSGASNTFAFERRNANSIPLIRNNIFYNGRSGGFGTHAAIANIPSAPTTNWTANTSGYNLLVADTPFQIGAWSSSINPNDFNSWRTVSGGDNTSWSDTAGALPANLFFNDIATGDLSIDSSNALCWYVQGKGIALAGMNTDIHGQSRSVTIASGGNDIGADAFPKYLTVPIAATVSGSILAGGSSTYTFAGRVLGKIYWNTGTFPTSIDFRYHSGEFPQISPSPSQTGALFYSLTNIIPTGGGIYNCDVELNYDSALFGSVSNAANIINAQASGFCLGCLWMTKPATPTTVDQVNKTFRCNGFGSLGAFTGTDATNPIPVKLIQFAGQLNKENADLYWNTASEINSRGFAIERSKDNNTWEDAGFVKARGNSNQGIKYAFTDQAPFAKGISRLYYRLRIVDNDGSYEYSKAVVIEKSGSNALKTEIYPNPSNAGSQLFITSATEVSASVTIADLQGKIISTETIQLQQGITSYPLMNIQNMKPGMYLVKVISEGNAYHIKLIKE